MKSVGRVVGIDLGTTYSAVATIGPDGEPLILPNREGERITPSVVLFQGDYVAVGSNAKQAAAESPDDVVQFVKRKMGDRTWSFVTSSGEQIEAELVSAAILRRLKEDAELALGEPVTHAVITVPAYFDDARRQATIDAGEIAGLNVLGVINEPTAAAVSDGMRSGLQGRVLVYDLGGGTFDVTVMHIAGTDFRVLAVQGDRNLGGFNWDNELMRYVAEQVRQSTGVDLLDDDQLSAELRDKVERAKRTLTTIPETRVMVRVGGKQHAIPVTRATFEEITRGLLAQTRTNVELALDDAELSPSDIDHLLLVGGSTRMPMVREMLTALVGRPPRPGGNPDESVALGAAVQASLLAAQVGSDRAETLASAAASPPPPVAIHDVTAHGLGVVTYDPDTEASFNTVLLPRNSGVPGSGQADLVTVDAGQAEFLLEITEGDDDDIDFVTIVGRARIALPYRADRTPIKVTVSFSADAVIFAEVFDGDSGRKLGQMEIERTANLTRRQLTRAAAQLRRREVS